MFNVIGLAGRARSGKDTVAALLLRQPGVSSYALADPVKMACQVLFGLTDLEAWGDTAKEDPIALWGKSPRQLFQLVGTEWMRSQRADHWIRRAEQILSTTQAPFAQGASAIEWAVQAIYGLHPEQTYSPFWLLTYQHAHDIVSSLCLHSFPAYPLQRAQRPLRPSSYVYPDAASADCLVIRDIRYENEADFIRSSKGQLWHVLRRQAQAVHPHSSEWGVKVEENDLLIDNNGSLEQLEQQVIEAWQAYRVKHPKPASR